MDIDVIIPVYKPDQKLFTLLNHLVGQSVPIRNIILMNTEETYFEQLISGTDFEEIYKNVKVFHLSKSEFDHGGTRCRGVRHSDAEVFVMMTQDAVPADEYMIERLIAPLQEEVAVSYARQLPAPDCDEIERYTRSFNYPEQSVVKMLKDLPRLGVKTYFCSNVCAAYRRDIYEKLGGFVCPTIFNEDMIYAAGAIKAGYGIAYVAQARVIHSHNYSHMQQLHRNFDLGVSQAQHPEVFAGVSSESQGKKLVKDVTHFLKREHQIKKLPYFYIQCSCKYAGYLLGKHYKRLPRGWILALTSNKEYWNKK